MTECEKSIQNELASPLIRALRGFVPVIEEMKNEGFVVNFQFEAAKYVTVNGIYPKITLELQDSQKVYLYPEERVQGKLMVKVYSELSGYHSPVSGKALSLLDIVAEYKKDDDSLVVRKGSFVYDNKNNMTKITYEIQDKANLF